MGRPKKNIKNIRLKRSYVHLSEEEYSQILTKSKNLKMSLSRYMRETALSSNDIRLPKIRFLAISEIRRIGNNINQTAHYLNFTMKHGGSVDNNQLYEEFKKILALLNHALNELIIK